MTEGTGRTCRTCKGEGRVTVGDASFTCVPCFGTGEEPLSRVKQANQALHSALPNICTVCRRPYPGPRHHVAGLVVCRDNDCIEKALHIWG